MKTPFEIFWPFKDIRDGNLKAILGLFFQLSRFKQQQKILAQERSGTQQKLIAQERSGTPKIPSVPPSPARWKDWTILIIFTWTFSVKLFLLLTTHFKENEKRNPNSNYLLANYNNFYMVSFFSFFVGQRSSLFGKKIVKTQDSTAFA